MHPTHQTILSLARAGNPVRAWSLFQSSGLGSVGDDPKVLTLKGRLLKDLARRAAGDERNRLYSEASDAYLAANALGEDSYPLINAAALACFAGDHPRAGRIAQDVLALIESDPDEGETAYWREATRAEAHLLLRQMDQATAALALAYKKLPFAHEDQAATLGQFDRILEAQGEDAAWLEPFRVPCSVNFSSSPSDPTRDQEVAPQTAKAIASAIEALLPGYGFGSLMSVNDLIFAEQVLDGGAELSLTFPAEPADICKSTFVQLGSEWEQRFNTVLAQTDQVELLPSAISDTPLTGPVAQSVTELVAMGQSLRRAEALRSRACSIWLGQAGTGTSVSQKMWASAGLPVHHVEASEHATGSASISAESLELCGLLLTSAPEPVASIAKDHQLTRSEEWNGLMWHGPMERVVDAAMACSKQNDAALAVHLGHPTSQPIWDGLSERLERLARADHLAKVKMGMQSAMIAKIIRPALRIEELGEIQTLSGHASIWSATQ
jgi:hypothetical protein